MLREMIFINSQNFRRVFFCGILISALAVFPNSLGFAKDIYPAKKITIIVPMKAGGGYDIMSRGVAPFLTKYLREINPGAKGGDVVIKNEPAASGNKAYRMIYNANPDGYTIGSFDTAFATESLRTKLDFDINKYEYLLQFNTATRLLVSRKNTFASWEDMMRSAKTKEIKWAVGQFGRTIHVASIIIKETMGIPSRLINYAGNAENLNALVRGDVQIATISPESGKALIDAGEIQVLVDFSAKSEYPGVPTGKDLGYPDLADKVVGHRLFIAPPGIPKDISKSLTEAFNKIMHDKEFQAWAQKSDIPLDPIFGNEADKMVKKMFKLYQQDMKTMLVKYLE